MLSAYPACFIKEGIGYSVVFPDLNYLSTRGNTLEEALTMAVDCLAGYLYWLEKDGETAPAPSSLDEVDTAEIIRELDLPLSEAFVNVVTVDVAEYAKKHFEKSVKKTLTIPAWLNTAALKENINFSQVLQEALKGKLHLGKANGLQHDRPMR